MPIDASTLTSQEQITAIYVAYYDRAPDPYGFQFWVDQLEGGRSIEQIATDFSSAAETIQKYPYFESPELASSDVFITAIYVNLFGRAPDAAGLDFWTDQLESGSTPVGEIILAILEGAQDEASGGFPDSETITNKIDVGLDWTEAAANAGIGTQSNPIAEDIGNGQFVVLDLPSFASATSILDGVDGTSTSVDAAKAATDAYFEDATNIGVTENLTTGIDNVVIGTFGTVDTVRGALNDDGTTDNDTFSSGDSIKGNGLTEVSIALIEANSGDADFVEMEGVNSLGFRGAGETGGVTFDAASYGTDLNNFTLSGGDGSDVEVENVEFDEGPLTFEIEAGTTGTLDVFSGDGSLGDTTQAVFLSTTGSEGAWVISDIGNTGLDIYAGADADVSNYLYVYDEATSADASVGAVSVGDVNMMAGADAEIYNYISRSADASGTGDASVGDMTVGNVSLAAAGFDASITHYNYAYAFADDGNATIGNWTVGDVSLSAGDDGYVYYSDYLRGDVSGDGDVVIGDASYGNIDLSLADDHNYVSMYHFVNADADNGNITVGDLLVGDFSFTIGDDGTGTNYVTMTRDAFIFNSLTTEAGDVLMGNITVGNIAGSIGDNSDLEFYFENEIDTDNGDATAGDITVGDVAVAIGESGSFDLHLENDIDSTNANAAAGNVLIGNVDLTMLSGAEATIEIENTANASFSGNAIVGNSSIGNINAVMDIDTELYISLDVSASGTGTMTAVGDITIGDVTLSGPVAINAFASLDVNVDSEGSIGAVTVGDVDVDFLADSTFTYNVDVDADGDVGAVNLGAVDVVADSIDYEVSVSGDNLLGGIGIGDIMLAGDDIDWSSIYLFASGDIGDVNVGNIMIDAATDLSVDEGIYISASGDVGNVTIGDISIMTAESDTFDVYVYAGDNVGDVTIGNLESSVSNTDFQYEVTVSGDADVGNVSIGDIDLSANATTSNADVTADLTFDAGTGDGLGNVTIGDINLAAAGAAELYATAYVTVDIGDDATAVGDVTFGDLTVTATAENIAAAADATDHYVYGGLYVNTTGGDISSVTVGDVNFTLTNSVDDSAAFSAADEYNVAYATLSIDLASAITVGDINLTAINESTVDVQGGIDTQGLFSFNITLSADGGAEDVTIGDITISGGGLDTSGDSIDNLATLTDFLSLTGDTITVGDIDYSGYSSAASIDVSGYEGAANITASSGGSDITVNTTQNLVTLGAGDDTVFYEADEDSGTTYAEIDKISGFESGSDLIDFSADGDITNVEVAGAFADYDSFLVAAQNAMSFDSNIDVFVGNDGTNTYVAIESDDDASDTIDYAIELTGVTGLSAGDFFA